MQTLSSRSFVRWMTSEIDFLQIKKKVTWLAFRPLPKYNLRCWSWSSAFLQKRIKAKTFLAIQREGGFGRTILMSKRKMLIQSALAPNPAMTV